MFVSLFMCGRKILQLDIDCIFLLDDKILTFFNYFRIGKRYYQNLMKVTVLIGRKSIFFPAETLYNVEIISVFWIIGGRIAFTLSLPQQKELVLMVRLPDKSFEENKHFFAFEWSSSACVEIHGCKKWGILDGQRTDR